jgi:hypothetical protein
MIAPICITVVFLAYLVFYILLIIVGSAEVPALLLFAIPLIGLGIGMIYVFFTRIREIRSGEEDDLGDY